MHAAIPLAVLEAMRVLDVPAPDGMDEYHVELTTKRLGMSQTVEVQIRRFKELAERDEFVSREEFVPLLQLAARRSDAALLFADAGRRAGAHVAQRISPTALALWRSAPSFARTRLGLRLARRVLWDIFRVRIQKDGDHLQAHATEGFSVEATPDGESCALVGSAVAAVLRAFTDFEGAIVHEACRARGAERCRWETATGGRD